MQSGLKGSESQHAAARNLIAAMVANSDVHHEDDAEAQRIAAAEDAAAGGGGAAHPAIHPASQQVLPTPGAEAALAESLARQGQLQARQEQQYSNLPDASLDPEYRDQVTDAFDQYGQITEEILAEWKEMFALFDFDNTGFIKTEDLGTVLRGLGRNLTEEFIATLINSYDANGSGQIDFPTFHTLMCDNAPMPGPCHEAQVMRDFAVHDRHRDGLIAAVDLVHMLRNMGEPLTRDDVDHLLQEIYIDGDNKINIQDFVAHMFRTSAPNPE